MLFNSLHFLIFFPITVLLYYILPHKYRWVCLLVASYYFYLSWNPIYAFLILFTTGINFIAALQMTKAESKKAKKAYLLLGLLSSLIVLFIFKYFNFLNDVGAQLLSYVGIGVEPLSIKVLLPVGISFYTFQTLSYTIDVYRGDTQVQKHFGIFALYVSFFPQLVAGPIERSTNLLPQFYEKHSFNGERMREGLLQMLWGLFKKMIIADRLAIFVNSAYATLDTQPGWILFIATIFFSFQIYCDFSGYSDIAIGAAKCMGFSLMQNFNRPYLATSIKEFWQRWHISLSTWFRDYVYIPLGGNRVKKPRHIFNLITTFTVSGLWHGANMTFVIWGFIHAVLQVFENYTAKLRNKIWSAIKLENSVLRKVWAWLLTFSAVTALWVVFRAENMKDAVYIYKSIVKAIALGSKTGDLWFTDKIFTLGLNRYQFYAGIVAIAMLGAIELIQNKTSLISFMRRRHFTVWWGVIITAVILILLIGIYGNMEAQQFIYFQF